MNRRSLATICLLWTFVSEPSFAAFLLPLGDLPGGHFMSYASDVSADGSVVVGWSVARPFATTWPIGGFEAFRWTREGGMNGLGLLPGDIDSFAAGVSADGAVVVGSSLTFPLGEAFRWTSDGGMVGMGFRPGNSSSGANAASADGSIVVGGSSNGYLGGDRPAFRWTRTDGMIDLGDLPGGDINSSALDVSADGSVIVGWSSTSRNNTLYTEAFRWTLENGMVGLGNLMGGEFDSQATAVSDDGAVIVGWSAVGPEFSERESFRWTSANGMVGLGDLPGGQNTSYAEDVSTDGSIVVGRSHSAIGEEAFIWDATHGMRRVGDVLTSLGIDIAGWSLSSATAVSADGTIIVGNGVNPLGQTEAWLANISVVPEPAGLVLSGLVLMSVVALRRARPSAL